MKRSGNILLIAGCILILGSLVTLSASRILEDRAQKRNAERVELIFSIIPPQSTGSMESYRDMAMPALQIHDRDFIGVVDIPTFGVSLPIYSTWDAGKVSSFPCRFWGTVYDGSLIVGGADQRGQFACLDQLWNGDTVTVTDMTGSVFTYTVSNIQRSRSAAAEVLLNEASDLTLFVRDAYNLEYILVRCVTKGSR